MTEDYTTSIRKYIEEHRETLGDEETNLLLKNLRITGRKLTEEKARRELEILEYRVQQANKIRDMLG